MHLRQAVRPESDVQSCRGIRPSIFKEFKQTRRNVGGNSMSVVTGLRGWLHGKNFSTADRIEKSPAYMKYFSSGWK